LTTAAYFVIGTDTNVGKTYIASGLVRHFVNLGQKTLGMKPIASGCEMMQAGNLQPELMNADVCALMAASNVAAPLSLINPYRFAPAIAPHIAASQEGVEVSIEHIADAYQQLAALAEVVIIEGAGGFFVPLNAQETLADLALKLDIPIILVVGMRLGCINHALLTVAAIEARGLKLAGWVANVLDPEMDMLADNIASLQQRIAAPCLCVVAWQGSVTLRAQQLT
jgi:dethiobiotin synthetase